MDIPNQLQDFPFHTGLKTDDKTDIVRQDRGKVETTSLPAAMKVIVGQGAALFAARPSYCNRWKNGAKKDKAAKKPKTIYLPRFKPPVSGDRAAKNHAVEYEPYKPPHQCRATDDGAAMKRQFRDPPTLESKIAVVQPTDVSRLQELLNSDWDEKDLVVLLVRRLAPNASWPVSSLAAMQIVSKLQSARTRRVSRWCQWREQSLAHYTSSDHAGSHLQSRINFTRLVPS